MQNTNNEIEILNAALMIQGDNSDFATQRNNIGFNKKHSETIPPILERFQRGEYIKHGDVLYTHKALATYKKTQLPKLGIDYDLLIPPKVETMRNATKAGNNIKLEYSSLPVRYKKFSEFLKTCGKASFYTENADSPYWLVRPLKEKVEEFSAKLKEYEFKIDDAANEFLADIVLNDSAEIEEKQNAALRCNVVLQGAFYKLYFNHAPTDKLARDLDSQLAKLNRDDDGYFYQISAQRKFSIMRIFADNKISMPDLLKQELEQMVKAAEEKNAKLAEYQQKMTDFLDNSDFLAREFYVVNGAGIGINGMVTLSDVQIDGIRHMVSVYGMRSILGDKAGVGKTLQLLCLAYIALQAGLKPIINVPGGLVAQWKQSMILFDMGNGIRKGEIPLNGHVEIVSRQNRNIELTEKPRFLMYDECDQGIQNVDTSTSSKTVNDCLAENTFGTVFASADWVRGGRHEHACAMSVVLNIPSVRNANSKTDAINLFMKRFGKGANADELAKELAPYVIERDSTHLNLPDAVESVLDVQADHHAVKYFNKVFEAIRAQHEEKVIRGEVNDGGMLVLLNALRRAYAIAMAKLAAKQIMERIRQGHKVVCIVNFTDAAWAIQAALLKMDESLRVAMAIGGREGKAKRGKMKGKKVKLGISTAKKAELANDFQTGQYDVFIHQMTGAAGLNLTAGTAHVSFDMPWISSTLIEQAWPRIRRQGQTKTCFFDVLLGVNLGQHGKQIGLIMWQRIVEQRFASKNFHDMLADSDKTMTQETEAAEILKALFS